MPRLYIQRTTCRSDTPSNRGRKTNARQMEVRCVLPRQSCQLSRLPALTLSSRSSARQLRPGSARRATSTKCRFPAETEGRPTLTDANRKSAENETKPLAFFSSPPPALRFRFSHHPPWGLAARRPRALTSRQLHAAQTRPTLQIYSYQRSPTATCAEHNIASPGSSHILPSLQGK